MIPKIKKIGSSIMKYTSSENKAATEAYPLVSIIKTLMAMKIVVLMLLATNACLR